tara:strand:- start:4596 stop:5552 length:957 start_codon:yes stop_codon:yes gene_type:complete
MAKIAVITPISHLVGVLELLLTKGEVFLYEESTKEQVRELLLTHNIDIILCNPNQQTYIIDRELLEGTSVKLINTCSTGMNHIDVEYCKDSNVEIYSLTHDMTLINNLPSTSELAFGLMMSLLRKIPQGQKHVAAGGWDYTQFMGRQIDWLHIGIVGYGRLGKMMAKFCHAFGAIVYVYDPHVEWDTNWPSIDGRLNRVDSLEALVKECDVVSLHVHVTDETKYMINEKLLGYMKKGSYIVNTSRGEIVDEQAIVKALDSDKLLGYATDVIEDEFADITKSPIVKAMNDGKNIIITPHVGGMTVEGQTKAYKWAIDKL